MLDVKNKKITIIGAARSGVSAALLLKKQGAIVFVSDLSNAEKIQGYLKILKDNNIEYETSLHSENVFNCSMMIISPGVPSNSQVVVDAISKGIKVISEVELAYHFCPAKIIAITGSNGKTTTTSLTGKIFETAGKEHIVAGNIGTAFSSVVESLTKNSIAIIEVSSFQLDHIDEFKPDVSVLLNITIDHLDRYDNSMEKYSKSKARIFKNQTPDNILIYNYDDPLVSNLVSSAKSIKLPFSIKIELEKGAYIDWKSKELIISDDEGKASVIEINKIGVKGIHNLYNSLASVLAARSMNISLNSISLALKDFKGVEHRLELVREINGVKYINDSKATNVDSVYYALSAFENPVILILGGRDKGNDYTKLKSVVEKKVKKIIAIGESAEKIKNEFKNVEIAISMQDAVNKASNYANAGDIVMLSPACASFDWFNNYEHRGNVFKELVMRL